MALRIGLFGGTFNPIHVGHLRAGLEVQQAFCLDKIVWIPSARPPHKDRGGIAHAQDRLAMVQLAIQDTKGFEVSDIELKQEGPSYTINTLNYFQQFFGDNSQLFFIVGQDAFAEIPTWKSYRELFTKAQFIVMARPGADLRDLEGFILKHISNVYVPDATSSKYVHPQWSSIYFLDITHLDISASRIRDLIKKSGSVRFLVPRAVEDYIAEKGLYR